MWRCPPKILGTLSKDHNDGSENVGKKINLRSFKLDRVYLDPLNISQAGDFSWRWILMDFIQVQKDEGKFVVARLGRFTFHVSRRSRGVDVKEMY